MKVICAISGNSGRCGFLFSCKWWHGRLIKDSSDALFRSGINWIIHRTNFTCHLAHNTCSPHSSLPLLRESIKKRKELSGWASSNPRPSRSRSPSLVFIHARTVWIWSRAGHIVFNVASPTRFVSVARNTRAKVDFFRCFRNKNNRKKWFWKLAVQEIQFNYRLLWMSCAR